MKEDLFNPLRPLTINEFYELQEDDLSHFHKNIVKVIKVVDFKKGDVIQGFKLTRPRRVLQIKKVQEN